MHSPDHVTNALDAYSRDLRMARKRAKERQQAVMTAAGLVAYASGGEHGIGVLVIHGAGGGADMGMAMAEMLVTDQLSRQRPRNQSIR